VALEAFTAKHIINSKDTCLALNYYPNDNSEDLKQECEEKTDENEKLKILFEAIEKSDILKLDDIWGRNVDYDEILVGYDKLEEKYVEFKEIYQKAFNYYLQDDGTIDEEKTESSLNQYIDSLE